MSHEYLKEWIEENLMEIRRLNAQLKEVRFLWPREEVYIEAQLHMLYRLNAKIATFIRDNTPDRTQQPDMLTEVMISI